MPRNRARVYIDGFNLYYGVLKRTPYRWLDLAAFARAIAPAYDFDAAFVVSGDSDLAEPIRIVRDDVGLPVYVVNPQAGRSSFELANVASGYYEVFKRALESSQFPPTLNDAQGTVSKPPTW